MESIITTPPPLSEGEITTLWLEDRDFKVVMYLLGRVSSSEWQLVEVAIIPCKNPL